MTDSRSRILAALTMAPPEPQATPRAPSPELDPEPPAEPGELAHRFIDALSAVHGEILLVDDDWPRRLAEQLAKAGIERLWYGPDGPDGQALGNGWPQPEAPAAYPVLSAFDQPIETCRTALFDPRSAGFTSAVAGIAETGSLVLRPTPAEPRTLSLVPEVHCVLLDQAELLPRLEDWMLAFCTERDQPPPSNLLVVTGPSKSADIEQTLTLGVHGPKRLLVLFRRSSGPAGEGLGNR